MKLTLRMRITLLTGAVIVAASLLLTALSIYNAESKIMQAANKAADRTVEAQLITLVAAVPIAVPIDESFAWKGKNESVSYSAVQIDSEEAQITVQLLEEGAASQASFKIANEEIYAAPANEASRQFNYASVVCMAAVCAVGMFIAYQMAGKALKPVHSLNHAITNISSDNLTERLEETSSPDEIAALTGSFNTMLNRLEESFWRQKRFASNAAHELKTPLATMKTGIQVLNLSEKPSAEECREVLEITEKQINRLINLVDDLMILSKQEYDEDMEPLCVGAMIEDIVEDLEIIRRGKQLTVNCSGIDEECFVLGNETLTYRMFYNIIENAVKYNKEGGSIDIKINRVSGTEQDNLYIIISDTGIGIDEEEIAKIFEAFYCVDNSRSRKLGGAGLGLSIVKDIADRYNWQISVKSLKGEGSSFEVIIPVMSMEM